ncbi:hypothetical protein HU200_008652 [Digitaria exilis]|uniref:Nudix hydrolase domain-containing protein n=1 Tax=Digitaria exilis TaxID=1010633 RepID=A0A835FLQ1_9POAL|nr:hypothetical protein HU200_008652 [Digitaria exilis]
MKGSLLVDSAAASLCATTAPRRRRAAGWNGVRFLSCSCSSRDYAGTLAWASYCPAGKMQREAKPVALMKGWRGNGHGWWTTAWEESSIVLEALEDEYGGMVVDADRLPSDTDGFARSLAASLSSWKSAVSHSVQEGFRYHHAEESYLMLTYWIPDEPCLLPENASHQVGVGGFVINDQMEVSLSYANAFPDFPSICASSKISTSLMAFSSWAFFKVLVVQEKYSASTLLDAWKLPTGFIHASEEIFTGVVREIKEETGIDTEFMELIAFRHAHNVAFQKSDLFFICVLRPLSNDIRIDEAEIQAAKWMPLAEFIEQPFIQEDHMFRKIADICVQRLRKRYCGLTAHHVASKFDGGTSTLYYNAGETEPGDLTCDAA